MNWPSLPSAFPSFASMFFNLPKRRAALVAVLFVSAAGSTLMRLAEANSPSSFLFALALGIVSFGTALALYVKAVSLEEARKSWAQKREKEKVAADTEAAVEENEQRQRTAMRELNALIGYIETRRDYNFDRTHMAKRAGDVAIEGYLAGIAKNRAKFSPGRDF